MTGHVSRSPSNFAKFFALMILALTFLSLAGCGSTKVYTADKTIVYNGTIYNLGNVQRVTSRMDGKLPSGDTVNMRTLDKKGVEKLLKENDSIVVTSAVELDGQDLVYQRGKVSKYSQYSSMKKKFDRALNDITKFMADKKKTQLKLK
jgi:hypothetical protein